MLKNTVIINLHGMLGNQLFQCAYAMHLLKERNCGIVLNTCYLPKNGYRLEKLGLRVANKNCGKNIQYYLYMIHTKCKSNSSKWVNIYFETAGKALPDKLPSICYLDGYWQRYSYVIDVVDEIKKQFNANVPLIINKQCKELSKKMQADPYSVMLHIRRGDYLASETARKLYYSIPMSYYENAIKMIKKTVGKANIYIFTNDKLWVKENASFSEGATIVDCDQYDYETLYLMASCNHDIIANSTLSWWGAMLNQNTSKTVIASRKWFNDEQHFLEMYPKEWIKM